MRAIKPHPHLCGTFGACIVNGIPSILLELFEGGSLDVALGVGVALLGDLRARDDGGDVALEHELRDVAVGRAVDGQPREEHLGRCGPDDVRRRLPEGGALGVPWSTRAPYQTHAPPEVGRGARTPAKRRAHLPEVERLTKAAAAAERHGRDALGPVGDVRAQVGDDVAPRGRRGALHVLHDA